MLALYSVLYALACAWMYARIWNLSSSIMYTMYSFLSSCRAPFEGIYDICRMRNSVVKLGLDLVTVTQRESSYVDPEEAIIKAVSLLWNIADAHSSALDFQLMIPPPLSNQPWAKTCFKKNKNLKQSWLSAFWKKIQNTQEIKRTLFVFLFLCCAWL